MGHRRSAAQARRRRARGVGPGPGGAGRLDLLGARYAGRRREWARGLLGVRPRDPLPALPLHARRPVPRRRPAPGREAVPRLHDDRRLPRIQAGSARAASRTSTTRATTTSCRRACRRTGPDPGGQAQPAGSYTLTVDAGCLASIATGRIGRFSKPPPQLGQTPCRRCSTHSAQNVHSYVQIRASGESGGSSRSQHSHDGRSSSMGAIVSRHPPMSRRERGR